MPLWVDLSEHQVTLNVYKSPTGKRLILRPLDHRISIPPGVSELGFKQHGDLYERHDLKLTLSQILKYFPKAFPGDIPVSEIYYLPPAEEISVERYQWQRNRVGGQSFGNRQKICPLTEALFEEHVKPKLRANYSANFDAYRALHPDLTHCSLVQIAGQGAWILEHVGDIEVCRPRPINPAWVKKVDDFLSPDATSFGGRADDDHQIFVFGSNTAGRHGKGAALFAKKNHGAIYGQGEGLQGKSYAIPTKDKQLRPLPLEKIAAAVDQFNSFAREYPDLTFRVTAIGCGLAGYKPEAIAPLFNDAPANCLLPEEFMCAREETMGSHNDTKTTASEQTIHPDNDFRGAHL